MSEQNPTEKGKAPQMPNEITELPDIKPRCPHCGRELPGLNILSMEMPTPRGGMVWLLPSCPYIVDKDGKAVDGGEPCGKIISAVWSGQYTPPKIATPGWLG